MKTENEIKQKIKEQKEHLMSGDLNIKDYEEIASGIVALQWALSNYNKGEQKMAMNERKYLKNIELQANPCFYRAAFGRRPPWGVL